MKNKLIYYYIFLGFLFLVQASFVKTFFMYPHFIPHLVMLLVVLFALGHELVPTLWFSFIAGILAELTTTIFFGSQILSLSLIGVIVYFLSRNFTAREVVWPTVVLLIAGSTLLLSLASLGYNWLASAIELPGTAGVSGRVFPGLAWAIVMNVIFFYPLNFSLKIIKK